MAESKHPWYAGMPLDRPRSVFLQREPAAKRFDPSAPIIFLARGHSGTRAVVQFLESCGVYMGSREDPNSLNSTSDSMYWAYGFERSLVPKLFKWGEGCRVDPGMTLFAGFECLKHHLAGYTDGDWGFKTCGAMFGFPLYNYLFPGARYIYLIRDGRDVTISHKGILQLSGADPSHPHWEYFKIITFGISNDLHTCPVDLLDSRLSREDMRRHKYWIQAKSWCEHIRMMDSLEPAICDSCRVLTLRYEDLCTNVRVEAERLLDFLELDVTEQRITVAEVLFHREAIGRWRQFQGQRGENGEVMDSVFEIMKDELDRFGYKP